MASKYDKSRLALHYSMPLDAQDWANLVASGVRLVQIPWAHALHGNPTQLAQLTAKCGVILRMSRADYIHKSASALQQELAARLQQTNGRGLEAVIVGNEPDLEGGWVDLRQGSPSWEQDRAYLHAHDTDAVRQAIGGSVRLVGAPLSNRFLTEDAQPEPGLLEWWAALKKAYHNESVQEGDRRRIVGVGVHIYEYEFNGLAWDVNTWRAKGKLWLWKTLWQPPLWVDEFAIVKGAATPVERMAACIAFSRMLEGKEGVALLSPFVSNGTGVGYDARLIMRDPAAYEMLGAYMRSR